MSPYIIGQLGILWLPVEATQLSIYVFCAIYITYHHYHFRWAYAKITLHILIMSTAWVPRFIVPKRHIVYTYRRPTHALVITV